MQKSGETSNWRRQIPNHQIRIRWGYLPDPQNSGGILKLDKDTMGFFGNTMNDEQFWTDAGIVCIGPPDKNRRLGVLSFTK